MPTLHGTCHCGNVRVELETPLDPSALKLRACQCSFCRKHGARTTSDPRGVLRIVARDAELLERYRFALGITDFLLCRACGVYVAATMKTATRPVGTLNVNVLEDPQPFQRGAEPVSYFRENVEERISRRLLVWTPAELRC